MDLKIIKNEKQYNEYCESLINILEKKKLSKKDEDNIELLNLLIKKWEDDNLKLPKYNPIELIQALMEAHNLTQNQLAEKLNIDKSLMSQILSYEKVLSKEVIRKISETFKLSQDALNVSYRSDFRQQMLCEKEFPTITKK